MDNATSIIAESYRVWCVYPISGIYTRFQRILFGVVMVFILFCQFHDWLTAGAIGFALSYSATSAIHAILMSFQRDLAYDTDILAVDVIVQTALYGFIMSMLFCPRILNRDAQYIYFGWLILLSFSKLTLIFNSPRLTSAVAKSLLLSACYQDGSCDDPCGRIAVTTMFRGLMDSLIPITWDHVDTASVPLCDLSEASPACHNSIGGPNGLIISMPAPADSSAPIRHMMIWSFKTGTIFSTVLYNCTMRPSKARDKIFRRLLMKRILRSPLVRSRWRLAIVTIYIWSLHIWWILTFMNPQFSLLELPLLLVLPALPKHSRTYIPSIESLTSLEPDISRKNYLTAKYVAICWYFWANLCYIFWIPAAISDLVKAESVLSGIPESESLRAVGQWSSWLTVCLALVAAILNRIFDPEWRAHERDADGIGAAEPRPEGGWWQVASWIIREWKDLKYGWRHPTEAVKDAFDEDEEGNETDDAFSSRMSAAWDRVYAIEQIQMLPYTPSGSVLPIPRDLKTDEVSDYGFEVEQRILHKALRKDPQHQKQA
jgi:hypothetical protein